MPTRSHPAYLIINLGVIVLIVLTFSIVLTPALGLVGFLIPPVLIGTAYIFVNAVLEALIHALERIEALFSFEPMLRQTDIHRFDYVAAPAPVKPKPIRFVLMDDGEFIQVVDEDEAESSDAETRGR